MIYISLFFNHQNHRCNNKENYDKYYDKYYESIHKLDDIFKNKHFYLFCDQITYDILNSKYIIQHLKLIIVNYEKTEVYQIFEPYLKNEIKENDLNFIHGRGTYLNNIKTLLIWNLKIYYMKYFIDNFGSDLKYDHVFYIDAGAIRDSHIKYFKEWINNDFLISDIKDINVNWHNESYEMLKYLNYNIKTEELQFFLQKFSYDEIPGATFCFHKKVMHVIYNEYIKILKYIMNDMKYLVTEQKIFTLTVVSLLNKGFDSINMKKKTGSQYNLEYFYSIPYYL